MIDLDTFEEFEQHLDGSHPRRVKAGHKPKKNKWVVQAALSERDKNGKDERTFTPSVTASNAEMVWIVEHLEQFYHSKVIADVTRRVKGGKEANVYCCIGHPESNYDLVAAKLYRPNQFKSLKNTTQYQQGRALLNADGSTIGPRDWRMLKAIAGKSRKGVVAAQTSWLMHEFTLMQKLHAAGADVPEPLKHNEYALLMEYVGDETMAAPLLIDVDLEPTAARPLFERLIWNIEVMLQCGWVHGDLSAYNVLYWEGEPKIIDFPQVVDPVTNPDAKVIFQRDVERVCQYFARYGVRAEAQRLANDLWKKCVRAGGNTP
jgi:RIO kinase 1